MEAVALLRTLGALGLVLALLAGALWVVRRFELRLPGVAGAGSTCRLAVVDRLAIDQRRQLVLVRRDGREHLLLLAPEGPLVVEAAIGPELLPPPASFAELAAGAREIAHA